MRDTAPALTPIEPPALAATTVSFAYTNYDGIWADVTSVPLGYISTVTEVWAARS